MEQNQDRHQSPLGLFNYDDGSLVVYSGVESIPFMS